MKTLSKNSRGQLEMCCPNCKEKLESADVESFQCCPYCSTKFNSDDVEDFVLDPVIRGWLRKNPLMTGIL